MAWPDLGREASRLTRPISFYATNKELVFDYLRDRLALGERLDPIMIQTEYLHGRQPRSKHLLMRGLHLAIVDEADSILVDEARTPLIISGTADMPEEKEFYEQALELAAEFEEGEDFVIDVARRQLYLTDAGRQRIADATKDAGTVVEWHGPARVHGSAGSDGHVPVFTAMSSISFATARFRSSTNSPAGLWRIVPGNRVFTR